MNPKVESLSKGVLRTFGDASGNAKIGGKGFSNGVIGPLENLISEMILVKKNYSALFLVFMAIMNKPKTKKTSPV